jgi:hypothetical protein
MRLFLRWCGFRVTGEAIRPVGKVILCEMQSGNLNRLKAVA